MKIGLAPAYGRDYASKKEIEGALKGEVDFLITDSGHRYCGKPINLPQLKEAGYTTVTVRYAKQRKQTTVELGKL